MSARHRVSKLLLAHTSADISAAPYSGTRCSACCRRPTQSASARWSSTPSTIAPAFYEQYGFELSPTDPMHLILLIKDLRRFIERTGDRRE